jgi:hypothetical protein
MSGNGASGENPRAVFLYNVIDNHLPGIRIIGEVRKIADMIYL